jgi:adenosylhomocysteinase
MQNHESKFYDIEYFKVLNHLMKRPPINLEFSDFSLFAVVPILLHFELLLRGLQHLGMQISAVIGIEYSSKKEIAKRLSKDIPSLSVPRFDLISKHVERKLSQVLGTQNEKNYKKLIILENGGYTVPILHKKFNEYIYLCKGAVEETKHGLWLDEQIEHLRIPVITIADTPLKQLESPIVGREIVQALENELNKVGFTVVGSKICVLGFGSIGAAIATALRSMGALVACYDVDPIKMLAARLSGFVTGVKRKLLRDADIVIGATGQCSIGRKDIQNLKDSAFLASASSKRGEIAVNEILSLTVERNKLSKQVELFRLSDGRSMYIIGDGYPINFLLSDPSCGPPRFFDLIVSDLFVGIMELMEKELKPGIHRISSCLEKKIAKLWLKFYE